MAAIALIVLTSICVYAKSLGGDFVYDDVYQVVGNPWIQDAGHILDILFSQAWSFEGTSSNYYRPLSFLIYTIDYRLFGFDPWGFHLVSILLHAAVAVVVFLLASRLMRIMNNETENGTKDLHLFPLFAALLFSTHPINSEPVMWISSLSDIAFTLFYLLALYSYIQSRRAINLAITSVLFFIACLGKETALTLPIMIFAFDALVRRDVHLTTQGILSLLKRYAPFVLIAAVYLIIRTDAIGGFTSVQAHKLPDIYQYMVNIFFLFAKYLGMLALPINLSAFHVFNPIQSVLSLKGLAGIALVIIYLVACYRLTQINRMLAFVLVWIAVPLLPVLYIPGLGENVFAERYLYLPSAGFAIFVSASASLFYAANSSKTTMALLMIVCLYVVGTVNRASAWESNLSLWTDVRDKSPEASVTHTRLASVLFNENMFDDAIQELKTAIRLQPDSAEAHFGLGSVYRKLNRSNEAAVEFNKALKINPQDKVAHYQLGLAYAESGQWNNSIHLYNSALGLDPDYFNAHLGIGAAYQQTNNLDRAMFHFRETVKLKPSSAEAHHNLGFVYAEQGRLEQAVIEYKQALSIDPDYALAHHNLGVAYGMKREFDLAINEFELALKTSPNDASIYFDLGVTYANKGDREKAIRALRNALTIEPDYAVASQLLRSLQSIQPP